MFVKGACSVKLPCLLYISRYTWTLCATVFDSYLVAGQLPCCKSPPLPNQASALARTQPNSLSLSISVSLCCTSFAIAQPFLSFFTFYRRGVGRSTREWAGAMDQWVRHMLTRISSYCMHLHCARTPLRCALHASHVAQLWHSTHTSGAEVGAAAAHDCRTATSANARDLRAGC